MGRRRSRIILLVASTFGLLLLATLFLAQSATDPAGVSTVLPLVLVGNTNSPRGERLSIFTVTNIHGRQIDYSISVEPREGANWTRTLHPWPPPFSIAAHQHSSFTVTNPLDGTWRVSLLYQKTPTKWDNASSAIRQFFGRNRMLVIARRVPTEKFRTYTVYSSEITE